MLAGEVAAKHCDLQQVGGERGPLETQARWPFGHEVLDAHEVQGNARTQATRQSYTRSDRDKGELPLARKPAAVDDPNRRA